MSTPSQPQNNNQTSAATANGIPRSRNGSGEGELKRFANPAYKKKWEQKAVGGNNQQEVNGSSAANGHFPNDQRSRRRDNRGFRENNRGFSDNGSSVDPSTGSSNGNNSNPSGEQNGDRKYAGGGERRNNEEYPRRRNSSRRDQIQFNGGNSTSTTNAPPQPDLQPHHVHTAQIDPQRLAETKRINSLINKPAGAISEEHMGMIKSVQEVVPHFTEVDIYSALQHNNFDQARAINQLSEEGSGRPWLDVVKNKQKPKEHQQAPPQPQPQQQQPQQQSQQQQQQQQQQPQYSESRPGGGRRQQYDQQHDIQGERQRSQKMERRANGQPQHYNLAPPVQLPQQLQQQQVQHQMQQQMQQQMHQTLMNQQQLQQTELKNQVGGEDLIMGLSKTIELQLAEIAEKTRMLLQMKNELETIHTHGKDQLTSLQEEQQGLLRERDRLRDQLASVDNRLGVIEVAIVQAEEEKMNKLADLQRKSILYATGGRELLTQ